MRFQPGSLRDMPKNLPPFPVPFYGRQDEVDDIVHVLLSTPGVGVAILGTGGIGKTAVATAVLHHRRVEEAYGAFRFFIPCDSATASSQGRGRLGHLQRMLPVNLSA